MEIECEFKEFFGYICVVTKASITRPKVDIISFKGNHQPGKENNDVTRINFVNVYIEYFPRNLQKIFPNLNTLEIADCCLKEISREDLIGLEKLVYLNLSNNQLNSLPDDLFSNMQNLKKVDLDGNKIEFASSKLIDSIAGNQLEWIDLENNTSIDVYYQPGTNSRCKTIQELMDEIDQKCKPPEIQANSRTVLRDRESIGDAAEEIFKSFNKFRKMGRYTDFVIVVGSKEFPVNKNILAAQSSVFAEIFDVKAGRGACKMEISEMSAEVVGAFLDYLYERKLPDARNAVEIFKLAAKYEVAKLKIICEKIILENLNDSNAFAIFKLVCGPHKSEKLKVAAFKRLQEKFGDELNEDLINNADQLQKIDDLITKSRSKKQRVI